MPDELGRPRLRIAQLTYSTRPRGGVVATLALAEALARAGHHVDVWTLARGGDEGMFRPVDPAVRIVAVPFPTVDDESVGARVVRSIEVLRNAFNRARGADQAGADQAGADQAGGGQAGSHGQVRGYDVVHAQDCISANAVPNCVRTVHHLDAFTTPELVACHDRALRLPLAHVCVSAAVAAELKAACGVTATVIPNGVDAARFRVAAGPDVEASSARQRWRERLGRYVLAVGGVEPRKGTENLVEAFARVRAVNPELALVIAGGETLFDYRDYRQRVWARAVELGVEPVVVGVVDHGELPALVAAATVFAFPSVKEGFGLAAMEALAAGVPVVARDLPVLREVFGDAVEFADTPETFADALLAASRGPDPARRSAGTALAARYSWDTAAAAHVRLYRELLDRGLVGRGVLDRDLPVRESAVVAPSDAVAQGKHHRAR